MSATRTTNQSDIIALHLPRTTAELWAVSRELFQGRCGDRSAAVLFDVSASGAGEPEYLVELSTSDDFLATESRLSEQQVEELDVHRIPLLYREHTVGLALVEQPIDTLLLPDLEELCQHLAVTLVNLKLNEEALRATDVYCASLQAFEQGVVLFQEHDREAMGARFSRLLGSALGTQHSALYVLEDIGDPKSCLHLDQLLGIPEQLLEQLCGPDGEWWPASALEGGLGHFSRDSESGQFGPLDPDAIPDALQNVVYCPLRYHGVDAGLFLAFNVDLSDSAFSEKLEKARRLCELGAALFHRLHLEQESIANRDLETQLQIAANIQGRLQPNSASDCSFVSCAWRSQPAQFVGGDYVDLLKGDSGELHAVIADVSGHGVNSALLMSSFRATYRALCASQETQDLLQTLNEEVHHEVGDTGMFVTAATLRIAADGQSFAFSSGGHNPVYWYQAATQTLAELESTGPSLGFFAGADFECIEGRFQTGDILCLYTDGIVEATDLAEEMFGEERLQQVLRDHADRSPQEILDAIHGALRTFTKREDHEDDVSVSILKIR